MRFETPLRASALAELLGPDLLREPLPPACFGLRLLALEAPDKAVAGSLTCISSRVPVKVRETLHASLALVEDGAEIGLPAGLLHCKVISVHAVLARLLKALESIWSREIPFSQGDGNHVHPTAVIEGILEGNVTIGPFAFVAEHAFIGRGTHLAAHTTVLPHVRLGRNCKVQSGVVIGSEGFGFFEQAKGLVEEMPHPAGVVVGDEVFIGAQTVIAAGVLHPTWIGRHCKLDSHVQIAHNVELGEGCMLASQSGIAGSTQIGRDLRMGGAASINGHLTLGDKVTVAACSAVTKDLPSGSIVAGFPAKPIQQWRRQEAALRQLGQALGSGPAKSSPKGEISN